MAEILSATAKNVGKTSIVYKTNLNFGLADKYLGLLTREGLVSVARESSPKYKTTEKGLDFLTAYGALKNVCA